MQSDCPQRSAVGGWLLRIGSCTQPRTALLLALQMRQSTAAVLLCAFALVALAHGCSFGNDPQSVIYAKQFTPNNIQLNGYTVSARLRCPVADYPKVQPSCPCLQ
jgi:hypothetical protein